VRIWICEKGDGGRGGYCTVDYGYWNIFDVINVYPVPYAVISQYCTRTVPVPGTVSTRAGLGVRGEGVSEGRNRS
jgi:hypothetical protein